MTEEKKEFDVVDRPAHYNKGKVECIDAIEAATEDLKGFEAVLTSQIIKYVWRWKGKNGLEDLKKARWYLSRLIARLEGQPQKRWQKEITSRDDLIEALENPTPKHTESDVLAPLKQLAGTHK